MTHWLLGQSLGWLDRQPRRWEHLALVFPNLEGLGRWPFVGRPRWGELKARGLSQHHVSGLFGFEEIGFEQIGFELGGSELGGSELGGSELGGSDLSTSDPNS
ncbi:MAG TPA: hypothetical protein P5218_13285 [Planctomycetota bacterium]|nr:hypothetical protein [Planctomycetota bacterium]